MIAGFHAAFQMRSTGRTHMGIILIAVVEILAEEIRYRV
jgi:hypothetical protein